MKPGDLQVDVESAAIDYDAGIVKRRVRAEFEVPCSILGPSAAENLPLFQADVALEVIRAQAVVRGQTSPSVTWQIKWDPSRSATGADVFDDPIVTTTTTTVQTTIANGFAKIPAGAWIWITTTATAGSVDALEATLVCRLRTDL